MGDIGPIAGGVPARARPEAGRDAEAYRGRDPRLLGGHLAVLGAQHRGPTDCGHGCRDLVGPSVARSSGPRNAGPSAKGVDANAREKHLLHFVRRLDIRGRSTVDKPELVDAVKKRNRHAPAK